MKKKQTASYNSENKVMQPNTGNKNQHRNKME